MRESRMTFGEHLEELRRRIIFSLLYLTFGVGICFSYGQELLQWTLEPHSRAFSAAQRDRLVARMTKTVQHFEWLSDPRDEPIEDDLAVSLLAADINWEVLFAQDIVLERMEQRLTEPFARLAESLTTVETGIEDSQAETAVRGRVSTAIGTLGTDLSQALVREFAHDLQMGESRGVLSRLEALEEKLRDVNEKVGPSEAQEAVGWGKDLSSVLEPVERFRTFLTLRRKEWVESDLSPEELRGRVAVFKKLPEFVDGLITSLEENAAEILEARQLKLMVISYLEPFNAYLKVSMIFGIAITIPFLLYEMWKFVGAGLYSNEQKYVVLFLPFSIGLFLFGGGFGYYIMIPIGLEFLAGWGIAEVNLNITLANYIGLFFTLTLVLGLVFQTPLVMIFFNKIGAVDVATLRRMRRVSIFVGVCLAVVLTPPDPFSWSLMALPMIILYEVGILLCDLLNRNSK
jgi:Tat protein translocase TatC